jgi:large subunit ribosomal protein L35
MPKLKTNKGAAKRLRQTKNGKFKRSKAYARHLKTAKTPKRRRNLRKATLLSAADQGRIEHLLPYGTRD